MTSQVERKAQQLEINLKALKTWKKLIETHLEGDEKTAELSELEEIVKEFCLIEFNASKTLAACEDVAECFNQDDVDFNISIDEAFKEKLAAREQVFKGDFCQEEIWKEIFGDEVEELIEPNSQANDEDYEEVNDSIMCLNVFTPPVDPISKRIVQEPYKNRVCGHIYEYKFIVNYVKNMKNKAKCPYVGCVNSNLRIGDLIEDTATKNKIREYLQNQYTNDDSE